MARTLVGIFIILVGLSFFTSLPVIKVFIALLLILAGLRILAGKRIFSRINMAHVGEEDTDEINKVYILTGVNTYYESQNFKGGELTMVMAGGDIDLTQVEVKDAKIVLKLVAILGGLRLKVPKNWEVKGDLTGILGGFENKTKKPEEKKVEVIIDGVSILGGIEIYS